MGGTPSAGMRSSGSLLSGGAVLGGEKFSGWPQERLAEVVWQEGHWLHGWVTPLDTDLSLGVAAAGWVSEEGYRVVELRGQPSQAGGRTLWLGLWLFLSSSHFPLLPGTVLRCLWEPASPLTSILRSHGLSRAPPLFHSCSVRPFHQVGSVVLNPATHLGTSGKRCFLSF